MQGDHLIISSSCLSRMKIPKTKKAVLFTQTSVSNRVCLDRAHKRFVSSRARKKIMQPLKAQKNICRQLCGLGFSNAARHKRSLKHMLQASDNMNYVLLIIRWLDHLRFLLRRILVGIQSVFGRHDLHFL